jgi:hypothetical protein
MRSLSRASFEDFNHKGDGSDRRNPVGAVTRRTSASEIDGLSSCWPTRVGSGPHASPQYLGNRLRWGMLRVVAKVLLILLLLSRIEPARAASATESYLGARDRYIAVESAKDKAHAAEYGAGKAVLARQERELGNLEKQLRRIVGPLDLEGFPREGTINLTTLVPELGFGLLDGLAFDSADKHTRIVVTTDALLASWLPTKNWAHVPRDIDGAVRSEAFYSQGIDNDDAAITKFAEIPVTAPPKARLAHAMLVLRAQDFTPGPPDEIIVTVVQGDKVFIVSRRHAVALDRIADCDAIARDYQAKADAASAAYRSSNLRDKASIDESEKFENDGDIAYRQCFGEHVKEQRAFATVIRQAQGIVDSLPLQ